jgi:lipase
LGPAARRLSMTFPDRATYLEFWKSSAFAEQWRQAVEDYANYDLTGTVPKLSPSASLEAVKQDSMDLYGGKSMLATLAELRQPVSLMTAPRGLLNETPGLYRGSEIERWKAEVPSVTIREVPDVNNYTIVVGAAGASAVTREVPRR